MKRKRYLRHEERPCKLCPRVFVPPPPPANAGHICPECDRKGNAARYQRNKKAVLKSNREWREKNTGPGSPYREQQRVKALERRAKRKADVYAHYGDRCACCGEAEQKFLTIDHIDGNGNAHRREIKRADLILWLWQHGMPAGFRVLCFNCNAGRYRNGGVCPHQCKGGSGGDRTVPESEPGCAAGSGL